MVLVKTPFLMISNQRLAMHYKLFARPTTQKSQPVNKTFRMFKDLFAE